MKLSLTKLITFSVVGPGMVFPGFKIFVVMGLILKAIETLTKKNHVFRLTFWILTMVTLLLFHSAALQILFLQDLKFSGATIKIIGIFIFLVAYQTPSIYYKKFLFYTLTLSEIILLLQFTDFSPVLVVFPADAIERYSGSTGASTLVGVAAIIKLRSSEVNFKYFLCHLPMSLFCCYVSGSVASMIMLCLYIIGIFFIFFRMDRIIRMLVTLGISLLILMTIFWVYVILLLPEFLEPLQVLAVFDAGDVKRIKLFVQMSTYLGDNPSIMFTGLGVGTLTSFPEFFMTRHFESGLLESVSAVGVLFTSGLLCLPLFYAKHLDTEQYLVLGIILLMFIFVPIFLNYFICLSVGYTLNSHRKNMKFS
jgi:hypothetical protein